MRGLILSLGFALVLSTSSLMVNRAPDGFASRQAETMTSRDVFGSARLTAAERAAHAENCTKQRTRLAQIFSGVPRADQTKVATALGAFIPPFCDCAVSQLEDRGSKMQLLMAMSAFEQTTTFSIFWGGPSFEGFKRVALRHGMSDEQFRNESKTLQIINARTINLCAAHVINSGSAGSMARLR